MGKIQTKLRENVHFTKPETIDSLSPSLSLLLLVSHQEHFPDLSVCPSAHVGLREFIWPQSFNTKLYTNDSQKSKSRFSHHCFYSGFSSFQQEFSTGCSLVTSNSVCSKPSLCTLPIVPQYLFSSSPTGIELPFFSWHMNSWNKKLGVPNF